MPCPKCRQLTASYFAINERVALCPACTEQVRLELTTLGLDRLLRGAAYALVCASVICVGTNVLLAHLGEKHSASHWIQFLAAVFMGSAVGRAARQGAVSGGLPLQLATIAITLAAVLEMYAGLIYADFVAERGPARALLFSVLLSPVATVLSVFAGRFMVLFWFFWAIYDPWRATAPIELRIGGPFPVKVPETAPPPPPPASRGGIGEGPSEAKAAGLDFERPQ